MKLAKRARRHRLVRACGGYRVRCHRGRVRVWCRSCGFAGELAPRSARRLARELTGILARFVVAAPRADREQLAEILVRAAARAEARSCS